MKCRHVVDHPGAGAATGPVGRVISSALLLDGKDSENCEWCTESDGAVVDVMSGVVSGFPRSFSPMFGGSRIVFVQY